MTQTAAPEIDWQVIFNRSTPSGWRGWGRVRAAQAAEVGRSARVAAVAQVLNTILLLFILGDELPWYWGVAWLLTTAAMIVIGGAALRMPQRRNLQSASRRTIERIGYCAITFAILWVLPAWKLFPAAGHSEQLAICFMTGALMAGAAYLFASVPSAAGAYVATLGGVVTGMLASTGSPLITAIGPAYTLGLGYVVLANGRAFIRRRCMELALEERTETVSLLLKDFESSDADWLWQTNRQLGLQNVSARFARAIGRAPNELEGVSLAALLRQGAAADPSAAREVEAILDALDKCLPIGEATVPIPVGGEVRWIELAARPRHNAHGRFIGYRGVGSDVTEARRAADRIAYMARHDSLTGLPNRAQLLEALGAALAGAEEGTGSCAFLMIDLDRFKAVNDTLGHVAGDHLLRQVSARFEPLLAPDMTAGRLGGDEFAVVVPDARDRAMLERLGQDLIEALKQPFFYGEHHLFVGASAGIAIGPRDGDNVQDLIRNSDLALYRAKDEGGDGVRFYEPCFHQRAEERRRIEVAIRTALEDGQFSLAYQPVFDAATGAVRSCEALLRWHNPELGQIAPARFIGIAEETGLIARIGEWVLRSACAEAARWPGDVSVAVNLSPCQIHAPGFMTALVSALSHAGLDPRRLELEITETVFLHVTPATRALLDRIQALGVRLAVDDFGTGYSSLGYLRETRFDTIKIDRSFIEAASAHDPRSGAIVRAVVALAASLGMTTVAEGVETEAQLELLRALGCDRIQGFLLSDALDPAAIAALLARRAAA